MKKGFDNNKYLSMQSEHIRERIKQFDNKLYLEFGGKLFDDYHASRVLPGFEPDSKLQMLLQLKDQAEVVIVISAEDIESNKIRGDYGITYDLDVLRLIDAFQNRGLYVGSVCLTKYAAQPQAELFESNPIATIKYRDIPMTWQKLSAMRDMAGMTISRPNVLWSLSRLPDRAAEKWLPAFPSFTMSINAVSKPAMPSLRPSRSGTSR